MLINSSVTNHLRKYFSIACSQYEEKNWGLAAFFAITLIEECAKILYLRDANLKDEKQFWSVLNHGEKHFAALVNLLNGSDHFDALPEVWKELTWNWFSGGQLIRLRNRGLYTWFSDRKELKVPDENISAKEAALLIYLSGFAAVELSEYVELDANW